MAEVKRYAHVEADGSISNVSLWDGVTPWSPPPGVTAVLDANEEAEIGGTHKAGKFAKRPQPTQAEQDAAKAKADALAVKVKRLAVLHAKGWATMTAAERDEATGLAFDLGRPE